MYTLQSEGHPQQSMRHSLCEITKSSLDTPSALFAGVQDDPPGPVLGSCGGPALSGRSVWGGESRGGLPPLAFLRSASHPARPPFLRGCLRPQRPLYLLPVRPSPHPTGQRLQQSLTGAGGALLDHHEHAHWQLSQEERDCCGPKLRVTNRLLQQAKLTMKF